MMLCELKDGGRGIFHGIAPFSHPRKREAPSGVHIFRENVDSVGPGSAQHHFVLHRVRGGALDESLRVKAGAGS